MEEGKKKSNAGRKEVDQYEKYVKGREDEVAEACANGADNRGLAKLLGIGLTTLAVLKKDYPEFRELVKKHGSIADENVISSLYKRAIGYEAEDTITEVKVSPDGTAQTTYVKKTKRHIPADTTAAIFWLKNRTDEWSDKKDVDFNATQPISISIVRDKS